MSDQFSPPQISVIVMTVGRPVPLRRCLSSLVTQTLPPEVFEVVIIDGSEPPVTEVVAEFSGRLRIEHVVGPNLGVAGNRNRGVARAHGRIVVFLDDDCVACPEWLMRLVQALEANPGSLIGGSVENPGPENAYAAAGQAITEAVDAFFNPRGQVPRFFPGLNFALERGRYLALGGCDEQFGHLAAEDRDFVDRWRMAGGRLLACPEARVRHEHRSSLKGFVRQYFSYGRGAWRYHSLRRRRGSGRMADDLKMHRHWLSYFRAPLRKLSPGIRVKVVALLGVWELANFAGFVVQAALEATNRRGGPGG